MKDNSSCPAVASTSRSICGSGNTTSRSICGSGNTVFRTCLIQVRKVDAYSLLPVFLFNDDRVGEPIRVFYFSYRYDLE